MIHLMKITYFALYFCLLASPVFSQDSYRGEVVTEKLKTSDFRPLQPNQCRIILLRHGETDWNVAGKAQGWTDVPLNEHGRLEAKELSNKFADVDIKHVYTSSLSRAVETAEIIAAPHKAIVIADPILRFYKNQKNWTSFFKTRKMKKAEMRKEISVDSLLYLKDLVRKHPGETVLIVTHGRVVKSIFVSLGNHSYQEVAIQNGGMATVLGDPNSISLETL